MRYVCLLIAAAVLILPCSSAFGQCPTRDELFLSTFFFFDVSCGSESGNVNEVSMSCTTSGADQFNYGSGWGDYTMTVPSDLSGSPWSVHISVDFDDPSALSLNGISATVNVW